MEVKFLKNEKLASISACGFKIPFDERYGFYVEKNGEKIDVLLEKNGDVYEGTSDKLFFALGYEICDDYLKMNVRVENRGESDFCDEIGFHTGVDSYLESYPQWHEPFFPTMLRCEKTHLWGYYMNTAENALAVATDAPVSSYDIIYNVFYEGEVAHNGHRLYGTDIVFIKNVKLPPRHPENLKVLAAGEVYENSIYYIPVEKKADIFATLSKTAQIPVVSAEKLTYEKGEKPNFDIVSDCAYKTELVAPDGALQNTDAPLDSFGAYKLRVYADNGKQCEAVLYCRKDWDFYLENAAKEAINKPQKATTHIESYYGLFSCFLAQKYFSDKYIAKKAYECFDEIMPYMFDMDKHVPILIPSRIQNTALTVSLLVDAYEANPQKNLHYLRDASLFGDWIINTTQDERGVYRKGGKVHYTCVIYIAKAMLELANAEKDCEDETLKAKYSEHYSSAKRAIDELVDDLDNIETEGEQTLEDGMISCSALQIGMLALTLPENEREKYIKAAEYMMRVHSCLEQQLVPDCRMNGASLRYWESQYDVMARVNMLNSPHGWTAWTSYAYYYLYMLTGKKQYLLSLMNSMGACAQLMSLDGELRWAFCAQPYVKGRALVPDTDKEINDAYSFVELDSKAYRGKYEMREFGEEYVDMISGWYRTGEEQKVTGGYEFCLLYGKDEVGVEVDPQGGCCDNDVHEIFKCMEETVLRKAFIYENGDGSFTAFGCRVNKNAGKLEIELNDNISFVSYNLKNEYETRFGKINGFGSVTI